MELDSSTDRFGAPREDVADGLIDWRLFNQDDMPRRFRRRRTARFSRRQPVPVRRADAVMDATLVRRRTL